MPQNLQVQRRGAQQAAGRGGGGQKLASRGLPAACTPPPGCRRSPGPGRGAPAVPLGVGLLMMLGLMALTQHDMPVPLGTGLAGRGGGQAAARRP